MLRLLGLVHKASIPVRSPFRNTSAVVRAWSRGRSGFGWGRGGRHLTRAARIRCSTAALVCLWRCARPSPALSPCRASARIRCGLADQNCCNPLISGLHFFEHYLSRRDRPLFRHLHASGEFKTHVVVPFLKTVISNAFFYPIIKSGSVFEKRMQLTCIDRLDLCLADQVMVDRDKRVHAATLPSSTMASILFAQAARTSGKHTAGKICGARNTEMYSFGVVTNALEGSDSKRSSPSRYRASQRAFREASSSCAFVTSDDATSYRPVFRIAGSTSSNTQTSKRSASGLWDFAMRR